MVELMAMISGSDTNKSSDEFELYIVELLWWMRWCEYRWGGFVSIVFSIAGATD